MKEQLRAYIVSLIDDVPHDVYEGLLSVLCAGIVILLVWKGWRAGKYIVKLMFMEYIFLLYSSTVFYRPISEIRKYCLTPFWSYSKSDLLVENIMNVVVIVPLGILLGTQMMRLSLIKGFAQAFFVGLFLSASIEVLQFVCKRGFSEVDDVIHNTLGCLIGYMIFLILWKAWNFSMSLFR